MAAPQASPTRRDRSRGSRSVVLLLALVGATHTMALEIDDIRITNHGRSYQVRMTSEIAAPVKQVIAILTDYGFPDRLDPEVTKREVISRHRGITRVRTEIRGCIFFFCQDIAMTQDVTVVAGIIQADIVPDESDFRSGYLRWSVTRNDNGGSHIVFEAVMELDFFVPPLIGRFFIRSRMRRQIITTAENLETEAAREAAAITNEN